MVPGTFRWTLKGQETDKDGNPVTLNIHKIQENDKLVEKLRGATFYKERWIKEDGLGQRLIVTFSLKKRNPNDCKRFIKKTGVTADGEVADKEIYELDFGVMEEEAKYDGFYAVCTNLEDAPPAIAKINHNRWGD